MHWSGYAELIMPSANKFSLADTIALLSRTPTAVNALLGGLPGTWTRSNEGSDTWTAFDVVGHLISADRADWMPRVRLILETGEARPFDPFDRFAQIKQNAGKSLEEILNEFGRVRTENLASLRLLNLQQEDLARQGKHPALGTVTLAQLLATWAVHDLNHLHQISRVMAHQYRGDVGPWSAYLGVLHCDGHSAS